MLAATAQGRTNSEMGTELRMSLGTVKTHLGNLQAKLAARNRVLCQQCVDASMATMEKLGRQRAIRVAYKLDVASMSNQAADIVARLRDQDVTSVLYAGDPLFLTGKARQQIWQPEWILAGTACTDSDIVGQLRDRISGPGPSASATSGRSSPTCCAN